MRKRLLAFLVIVLFPGAALSADATEPAATRQARERMVREQIQARGISRPEVLNAMRSVPRHWFVPADLADSAYQDHPLPIGEGQTISQPYIVALMTELLDLKPTDQVLEIGTGSGYQAAILSGLTSNVYTIEIKQKLFENASNTLKTYDYKNVKYRHGDGYFGWPEAGPFDAIMVTAAAGHVPPPLLRQLKPGGRMVIPIGAPFMTQQLMLVEKDSDGKVRTRQLMPVRFVPLTGSR